MEVNTESSTKPNHITVEIPTSTATILEEPQNPLAEAGSEAPESTSTGLSTTQTAVANIVMLATSIQNSIQQPPPPPPSNSTTPTPTSSSLRKRFSVSGSGVASSYPYPVGPDQDEESSQSTYTNEVNMWKVFNFIELAFSMVILGFLMASLTIESWKHHKIWDIYIWKWCLLIFIIVGGRLATEWIMNTLFLLMKVIIILYSKNKEEDDSIWTFSRKEKFVHIVLGLRKSFQLFIWLAFVLLAWGLLLDRKGNHSKNTKRVLDYITRGLVGALVGAGIWWFKALQIELAAYDFIVERSMQRMVESIFDQEALKNVWDNRYPLEGKKMEKEGKTEKLTDDFKLKEKVRSWTPPKLIDTITRTELPVVVDREQRGGAPERVARATADELFARIAGDYDAKYVDTDKVLASIKEEYKKRIPVSEEEGGAGKISRSSFRKWVIKIHLDRLLLLRTLNGRDDVVRDFNKIVSGIVLIIILVVWLLVMGFLTTNVMLLIATQIVALNFMFNNTARTVFEAIIFVFVTRPFDVGDLCSIDDKPEQVVVHDMNILNTIFRKSNGEKLFYPNAVLVGKSITNYYGIPETSDSVEFTISAKTKSDKVQDLKSRIQEYLKSKPKHWKADAYSILVEDIDRVVKSVEIYVDHVVNFYNGGDRKKHRKELLDEVNNIMDDLKIDCRQKPQ